MKDYSFFMEGTNGKGVLLIHGLTGIPSEMQPIGKLLNRKGYTVYAPLLAGHGGDEATLIATKYEDWLESLRVALRDFKEKVSEVYTAGICVGGLLGLYLSHLEPGIKKTVVYGPLLEYDGWNQSIWNRPLRMFGEILVHIPAVRRVRFKERHPFGVKSDRIRNAIFNNSKGIEGTLEYFPALAMYENNRLNKILKKALPHIKTPTLLIHAKEDDVCHPRNSYKIQKLHGGECKIAMLYDSYHMIHIDQERGKVGDMTADFLDSANAIEPNK